MTKQINFDMDGTIANFYGVENWLDYLIARDPYPYAAAKPLVNMSALARQLNRLQRDGYEINIISWLAKNSTEEFDEMVTITKIRWLRKHLPSVHWDNIFIVKYGTNKATLGSGILFDDEVNNRIDWGHGAYDARNILRILRAL